VVSVGPTAEVVEAVTLLPITQALVRVVTALSALSVSSGPAPHARSHRPTQGTSNA
jgi:hypothetical protein